MKEFCKTRRLFFSFFLVSLSSNELFELFLFFFDKIFAWFSFWKCFYDFMFLMVYIVLVENEHVGKCIIGLDNSDKKIKLMTVQGFFVLCQFC